MISDSNISKLGVGGINVYLWSANARHFRRQIIESYDTTRDNQHQRPEAEKYEFIHESCVLSLLFFQPNNRYVLLHYPVRFDPRDIPRETLSLGTTI